MPLLIKICGLKTPEALDVALFAGADMVGFVFFPPSPRHIDFEAARPLAARVRGRALKVVLSVDADDGAQDQDGKCQEIERHGRHVSRVGRIERI